MTEVKRVMRCGNCANRGEAQIQGKGHYVRRCWVWAGNDGFGAVVPADGWCEEHSPMASNRTIQKQLTQMRNVVASGRRVQPNKEEKDEHEMVTDSSVE